MQNTVSLTIPFESLLESVQRLPTLEKRKLLELLDIQLAEVEEEMWERDPLAQAELREARTAYHSGNYVTIDEYIEQQPAETQ